MASAGQPRTLRRPHGRRLTVASLAVGGLLSGIVIPGAATAAPAGPPVPTGVTTADAATRVATLVTGDRVVLTGAGARQRVAIQPRSAQHRSFITQRAGGHLYVIPSDAVPYLGRSLDLALFDVSALARDGAGTRLPVRVSYAAGAAQAAPAGVTVTGAPNVTTKDGYLTMASAPTFGAALAAQRAADARAHWAGDRRLFGGVTSIRYAGPAAGGVAHPLFPMFTLRLSVLDGSGGPAPFAFLSVVNVDDPNRFAGFPTAVDGEARISVPAGHYAVQLISFESGPTGEFVTRVAMTEFDVTGARTAVVDARTATSRIAFQTPRPANLVDVGTAWYRGPDDTIGLTSTVDNLGTDPMYVSPRPAATVGVQHYYALGLAESSVGTAAPYTYRVEYPSDGAIGANQRYVVTAASLATVDETYYSDKPQAGGVGRFGALPWEGGGGFIFPLAFPLRRTEYVTANPAISYQMLTLASYDNFGGILTNVPRAYGQRLRTAEEWYRQPLAPGFPGDLGGPTFCAACRNGDLLSVLVTPVTDSTPDHGGFLDFPQPGVVSTSRFRLLSGSTVIADEADVVGGDFTVPAAAAPYKIVYDQTRRAPWFALSPVSHTEWTFTSAHSGTNTVPDRVFCAGEERACSPISLLTLSHRLGTALDGTMPAGPATLTLTVGHTPGAAAVPITSATVSVSFDAGRTWTPVTVRDLGAGTYRATWTNPASAGGGPVALRIGATDAAGSTVTQTVQRASVITPGGGGA
jgi:hypothetical protein